MDDDKLKRLREKYLDAGAEIFDPRHRAVADRISSHHGDRPKPWAGIPTLLDAPATDSCDGLDVALIGVPMDLGVSNRPGARFGPRALRSIERIGPYNHALDVLPLDALACSDVGDVPFRSRYSLEESIEDIETFYRGVVDAGVKPLSVGGDHSISHPILCAVGADEPVGMLHIDAHCDTGGPLEGAKFYHGGPFRQALLAGVLDPDRTVQIGIRGSAEFLWELSYESGMTVIHGEEIEASGVETVVERARQVVGEGPVYVSFDIDAIDPALAPGTGTPEVGGLTPREAQAILHGIRGLDIVGGDVVEVAPQYDTTDATARIAAQMLFEILSLMAVAP